MKLEYRNGIYLPAAGLWLDPRGGSPRAIVSHAHSDHVAAHAVTIATPETLALMKARSAGAGERVPRLYGEPWKEEEATIELLPSGHVLGAAQIHAQDATGSLLYTGDFKMRPGLSCEPVQWKQADILIMETTFGLPSYIFPPLEEIRRRLVHFCSGALEDGDTPVLFCYSLGKSQEVVHILAAAGLPLMAHGAVFEICETYRQFQPQFPHVERYRAGETGGHVLICPPSAARSPMVRRIPRRRTCTLTGWALAPNARFRLSCDEAFPLSDHADYPDLMRYVELVNPRVVYTVHGFAKQFAADLRRLGREAWALGMDEQLELAVNPIRVRLLPAVEPAAGQPPEGSFGAFALMAEAVAATAGKLSKVETVADFLQSVSRDEAAAAARWLSGLLFPRRAGATTQVGGVILRRALAAASGLPGPEVRQIARRFGDFGDASHEILRHSVGNGAEIATVQQVFEQLAAFKGPNLKTERLREALTDLHPLCAKYLVKLLTGDLRIGLKEGLVEDAIARASGQRREAVQEAAMLLGDPGEAALLAFAGKLEEAELEPFRPVKCMLASPEPTAEAIWRRMEENGTEVAEVEFKFDGIRAQLHKANGRACLFSRDLRDISSEFPEIVEQAARLKPDFVLDGELIAGPGLDFFDLQKRLGRNERDLFFESDIPVQYVAFDLLWANGFSHLRDPLSQRRAILDGLDLMPFLKAERFPARSPADLELLFSQARAAEREGLMIKAPGSAYTPGRRGFSWIKFKKELSTLDVVVVAAEWGHGKRSGVLSDYTFAVREDSTGALLPIGKAYSGLTDDEIAELTEIFLQTTLQERGRVHEVEPKVVLEIAFDSIQPSKRHASGLAMRFPRIKAIRRDKNPGQIDSLSSARRLAGLET